MSSKGGSAAVVWQLLPQCAALPWFKPAQPWFNPLPWSGTLQSQVYRKSTTGKMSVDLIQN